MKGAGPARILRVFFYGPRISGASFLGTAQIRGNNEKSEIKFRPCLRIAILSVAIIWALPLASVGQSRRGGGVIDAGTTVAVRTVQEIETNDNGKTFPGVVDRDVKARNGRILIPKGSDVELVVKKTSNDEVALDLDSVTVNGQRYSVEADPNAVDSDRKEGVGANKRTGKYVGGGAAIGAIIGAIAGGGKGAAIGAGAGAAGGAGAQVLTRGKAVHVPAETLLTFRLTQPLRAGVRNSGLNGRPHSGNYEPRTTGILAMADQTFKSDV